MRGVSPDIDIERAVLVGCNKLNGGGEKIVIPSDTTILTFADDLYFIYAIGAIGFLRPHMPFAEVTGSIALLFE